MKNCASQEDLEASKSRYFDLYDLAPVSYLTLSEQGLILEANLSAATMLGVVRNDLLKKSISQNIFPDDQDDYYLLNKRHIETGKLQTLDIRLVRADGSSFWVHLKATPAHNGEYGITFTDISKRKQAETALVELHANLKQRVEEESDPFRGLCDIGIFWIEYPI